MKKSLLILACTIASPAFAASCESLAPLALPDSTITSAQVVPAGQFTQPGAAAKGKGANAYKELPDFCRVTALHSLSSTAARTQDGISTPERAC